MIIMTKEQYFLSKAYLVNDKIKICGEYYNSYTKIDVKCKRCGYEWKMLPSNILKRRGCPKCANNIKKTTEDFIKELSLVNNEIEIISNYNGAFIKIDCKCKKCSNIWSVKPTHLLEGHGCPNCLQSTGERTIKSILDKYKVKYIRQQKFDDLIGIKGGKLSFDFYLPDYNLLIEYQGRQHYQPSGYMGGVDKFNYQIENDKIKRRYVNLKNINYLEISYKDDIKNKLLSFLETVTTAGCQ